MNTYKQRIADKMLQRRIAGIGAVLIEGPKWCGKTTTAMRQAKTVIHMDDPMEETQNLNLVEMYPTALLSGTPPILLDEWQLAPKLWDIVRTEVDRRNSPGQFILTGSAVPVRYDSTHHSGTGRFAWLTMRPMSLYESGESNGEISLATLFTSPKTISGKANLSLEDVAFLICRGGWPYSTTLSDSMALDQAKYYYDGVVRSDVSRVDGTRRNAETTKRLMRSYARHQGTQATLSTIADDIRANDKDSADIKTVATYIDALRKIFVVEDVTAWNPNLRSKSAIRTSDTRYFVDPSIAVAALGFGPKDLMTDLNTMGLLYETLAIRDLRVYADALDGQVHHFRDKSGLECDAVLHLRNGKYGLIEIKLGGDTALETAAKSLKTLVSKIDTVRMNPPAFLMVLTAVGKYAYTRPDGIHIVPIGCLKD